MLAGILFGFATPTEVAAFAVIYGLFLSIFVYRGLNLGSFLQTVIDTAALSGVLLFIFAAASGFSCLGRVNTGPALGVLTRWHGFPLQGLRQRTP